MNNAIKLGRLSSQSSTSILSPNSSIYSLTKSTKGGSANNNSVRFVQASSDNKEASKQPKFTNMDAKKVDQKDKNLNVMEESFGKGYATRSDEEGFGGVYGGNDENNAEMKVVQDPAKHDSSQGSEVKEKEAARNQAKAH